MLRIPRSMKVANTDLLQDLDIGEHWGIDRSMIWKLEYFGHVLSNTAVSKKTIMEGGVLDRRGRGRPVLRWTQDSEYTLGMRVHASGELATCQQVF